MADANERFVVREGKDWMELKWVDPRRWLWVVIGGTVGAAGDIVRFPVHRRPGGRGVADQADPLSPFEAEIVVDMLTRAVLLPLSGTPSHPARQALKLLRILEAAQLNEQARIVRELVGTARGGRQTRLDAA